MLLLLLLLLLKQKRVFKLTRNLKGFQMVKTILKKKNKVLILLDFKTQHKDTIIKTVWYCQKTDLQTNGTEYRAQKYTLTNVKMIFNKSAETTQCGKNSLFNKWCRENWIPAFTREKMDPYLTAYTKINARWIEDLDSDPK